MPRRTSTPFTSGETSSNQYVRLPDGRRMLLSDLEQARMAGEFGGGGAPREFGTGMAAGAVMGSTTSAAPEFYENRFGVFQNTPSMEIFPSGPDYAGTQGDDVFAGNFEGDNYQSFAPAPTPRLEPSFLFGGPTVETATGSRGSSGNLDNEPSLFPQETAVNSYDEWWKSPTVTGAAGSVSAGADLSSNDGGSIWSGDDTIGNFGGYRETTDFVSNSSLGNDLNVDPALLNEGFGYPAPGETDIPVEPAPLNQNVGDLEWTTSPGDRRFLRGSGEPTVETPTGPSGRGGDITSFGTHGNPLSLGQFFGNSLESMRFGTDRYVQGGEVTAQGEVAGGLWTDPETGQTINLDDLPVATGGTTVTPGEFNAWPRGELLSPQPPPGMKIIGHDTRNGQPIYEDANGNRFVNPGTGTAASATYYNYGTGQREALRDPGSFSDSGNQGAEQSARSPVKFGQNPASDAGHNLFNFTPGSRMLRNSEGGFESVSSGDAWLSAEQEAQLRAWGNLLTSAEGRAYATSIGGFPGFANTPSRGVRGTPQSAGAAYGGTGG